MILEIEMFSSILRDWVSTTCWKFCPLTKSCVHYVIWYLDDIIDSENLWKVTISHWWTVLNVKVRVHSLPVVFQGQWKQREQVFQLLCPFCLPQDYQVVLFLIKQSIVMLIKAVDSWGDPWLNWNLSWPEISSLVSCAKSHHSLPPPLTNRKKQVRALQSGETSLRIPL